MKTLRRSPEPILVPKGFSFAAIAAGIKASGRPDLALACAEDATAAAAVFTRNRVVAAPVEVGRASLKKARGRIEACWSIQETPTAPPEQRAFAPAS